MNSVLQIHREVVTGAATPQEAAQRWMELENARRAVERRVVAVFLVLAALALLLLPFAAGAQELVVPMPAEHITGDAGPVPTPPPAPVGDAAFVVQGAAELLSHAKAGRWALLVIVSIMFLARLAMRFGRRIEKLRPVLDSPWATWLVPMVISILGTLVATLSMGTPLSVDIVLGAIVVGLGGGGVGAKEAQIARAEAAGEKAAAAVDTREKVAATLAKGPDLP